MLIASYYFLQEIQILISSGQQAPSDIMVVLLLRCQELRHKFCSNLVHAQIVRQNYLY